MRPASEHPIIFKEKAVLDRILSQVRGNDLLQIGTLNQLNFTEKARVSRIFYIDQHVRNGQKHFIQANPSQLPIQSEAMDIILLMHELETAQNPLHILKETYRVLRPNGQLIIVGFNRWSIRQLLYDQQQNLNSMGKIKRILRKLQVEITHHQTFYFCTPFVLLETLGQIFLPYAGAIFVIRATKSISGVTPLVDESWKKQCNYSTSF